MLYDVEQIANLLSVSKVTVYNKLKLKEVLPHVVKKQGKTWLEEEGFNFIKDSLNLKGEINERLNYKEADTQSNEEVATDSEDLTALKNDLIGVLKDEIEFLKSEIQEKNKQLESKDKLLENMQVLIKSEQRKQSEEQILLLEAHFKELDERLRNVMESKQIEKVKSKRSWLDRLINKDV